MRVCVWCVSICMDASANLCVKGANIEENMRAQETAKLNSKCVYYTAHARRVPRCPV